MASTLTINSVWDYGEESFDRYTVVYGGLGAIERNGRRMARCMSKNPCPPQGFGQIDYCAPGPHLGKRIKFHNLPNECRELVLRDLEGV